MKRRKNSLYFGIRWNHTGIHDSTRFGIIRAYQEGPSTICQFLHLIIMNQIATIGAWIVGPSYLLFIVNLVKSAGSGKPANMNDPFKIGEEYYDYARREPHH